MGIGFSIYGDSELYIHGAIQNALEYPQLFPGWELFFFVGDSVDRKRVRVLTAMEHVCVIEMKGQPEDATAMFWRFLLCDVEGFDTILFRDADSRPSRRERAAVDEWMASGKTLHIMRDHMAHGNHILGGLWGIRSVPSLRMGTLIDAFRPDDRYGSDQRFLAAEIYPRFVDSALAHQSEPAFQDHPKVEVRDFPTARNGDNYLGQGFEPSGALRQEHATANSLWVGASGKQDARPKG